jgi:hypothetical protein
MAATAPAAALLLLSTPTGPESLRTRFRPTISDILPFLAEAVKNSDHVARLDVGIVLPKTFSTRLSPRASVFLKGSRAGERFIRTPPECYSRRQI